MKRLLPLFCILVVLVVSAAGVASADKPLPGKFVITILKMDYGNQVIRPSDRIKFDHVMAYGTVDGCDPAALALCPASFEYEERGNVDFSFTGTNQGEMTITVSDEDRVVIRFNGQVDSGYYVSGHWVVLSGSGSLSALHGQGTYSGSPYEVQFEGQFN